MQEVFFREMSCKDSVVDNLMIHTASPEWAADIAALTDDWERAADLLEVYTPHEVVRLFAGGEDGRAHRVMAGSLVVQSGRLRRAVETLYERLGQWRVSWLEICLVVGTFIVVVVLRFVS